jgi:general secretion pathway protein L
MDRLTPFKPDQVTYAYRVLEVDHVGQQFSVELHVVQKSEVERAAKTAQRFGLVATRFELAGLPDENREPLNLRSAGQKEPLRKGQRNWAPAVPASILALVALAIPVQRQLATAAQLEAQLSASRTEAEATLALSKRIKKLDGRVRFLQAQKTQRVTVIEILAELTSLLPDEVHILQLNFRDNTIQLYGIAKNASDVILLLGKSSVFASSRLTAPVTTMSPSDLQNFHVSIELAARPTN